MVQGCCHLLSVEPRIQRNEDSAQFEDGIGERGKLGAVSKTDSHSVPFLDAKGTK